MSQVGLQFQCTAGPGVRPRCVFTAVLEQVPHTPVHTLPCIEILRSSPYGVIALALRQRRPDRAGDCQGDLVLKIEDIADFPVVTAGPDLVGVFGVDKLRVYSHLAARLAHAACHDVVRAEFPSNQPHIDCFVFVSKARIPRDDGIKTQCCQGSDQVLGQAVREILLVLVAAQVSEWQYGNRRPAGKPRNTRVNGPGLASRRRFSALVDLCDFDLKNEYRPAHIF